MTGTVSLLGTRPALSRPERRLLIVLLCLLLVGVGAGSALLADRTRPSIEWLDVAGRLDTSDADRAWLATGSIPLVEGVDEAMIGTALLDLHQLGREAGVPVAGWHPAWHYVWLRDSSLAAVAFARTGHLSDAEQILDFLQAHQPESGLFAPRYRIDGSGPPDGRDIQLDGVGWALWSLAEVAEAQPADQRRAFVERYRPLLDRSSTAALRLVDRPQAMPPASPDYWELPERRLTLATAAMINAGLGAAASAYAIPG